MLLILPPFILFTPNPKPKRDTSHGFVFCKKIPRSGVLNLWDLMLDDLRWSWCNNNRSEVDKKGNAFGSYRTIPSPLVHGKVVFHETSPWCQKGCGPLPQLIHRARAMDYLSRKAGLRMAGIRSRTEFCDYLSLNPSPGIPETWSKLSKKSLHFRALRNWVLAHVVKDGTCVCMCVCVCVQSYPTLWPHGL